jgi:hypothetical protein
MSIYICAFRALFVAFFGAALVGRGLYAQPGAQPATTPR